jgi:predicted dehydrogenase
MQRSAFNILGREASMNSRTRRGFLRQAGLGMAGAAAVAAPGPTLQALGAGRRLVFGLVGCGGRGRTVAGELAAQDAKAAYVCDPDQGRREQARRQFGADRAVADLRRVLDDKSVDAVVIATPDHWHAPAAILACDAGKHVYVEKPCCHNIREGRLMIEAARRNHRIVQVGTQSRSTPVIQEAIKLLREGALGEVLVAKAWNSQRRGNIGHRKPSQPPAGFDYDLWVGPAEWVPFQANRCHYAWHWWYNFGTGDAGNDGVHELDIARWGLGVETHPSLVTGHGLKMFFDDDQQFPDTQYVTFEYPGDGKIGHRRLLIYEQRIWSPYVQEGHENGNAFYGTEGMLILGKENGWQFFGPRNKLVAEQKGQQSTAHHVRDFIDAIRSDRQPNADIATGHLSTSLSHLANILARVGRRLRFDPQSEQLPDDQEAGALVRRTYRPGHWAVPKGV